MGVILRDIRWKKCRTVRASAKIKHWWHKEHCALSFLIVAGSRRTATREGCYAFHITRACVLRNTNRRQRIANSLIMSYCTRVLRAQVKWKENLHRRRRKRAPNFFLPLLSSARRSIHWPLMVEKGMLSYLVLRTH